LKEIMIDICTIYFHSICIYVFQSTECDLAGSNTLLVVDVRNQFVELQLACSPPAYCQP